METYGGILFDGRGSPGVGDKVFLVMSTGGEVVRWEPHPGAGSLRKHAE